MRLRYKLGSGVLSIGAVAVLTAVVPATVPAFGAHAPVTTAVRSARHAAQAVRAPRRRPTFDAMFGAAPLNTKIWATCYWWAGPKGCKNFTRHEFEWYLPSQVRVSGGLVRLVAQRKRTVGAAITGKRKVYGCRSGMLSTYRSFKFKYGFVQVVARIPRAKGLWSALWLHAENNKSLTEIDMVETMGVNFRTASFYHLPSGRTIHAPFSPALTRGWQTYSLSWTTSRLKYYVGNRLVLRVTRHVPHQRMYFLADVAEYLPAKPGNCAGQLDIRSVKIWQR